MRGARGSEVALPATRITQRTKPDSVPTDGNKKQPEGLSLRLSVGNRQFREATAFPKTARKQPLGLFDRRVHRRRQGLGVNGLIMVEAAAQHQGGGEDGKGQ